MIKTEGDKCSQGLNLYRTEKGRFIAVLLRVSRLYVVLDWYNRLTLKSGIFGKGVT